MLVTVRRPGVRMAPIRSISACCQLRWKKSGAKQRMIVAKPGGSRSMVAALWREHPSLTAHPLRCLRPATDTVGEVAGCALASLLEDQLRGAAMSLRPAEIAPVPATTAQVAVAAFPRGCAAMRMRDELGAIYNDQMFASLFPARGQPAYSPWRLALVTVLQFAEALPDRQAADAVRGRIDWKY